jgi:hypothetical protein
MIFFAHHHTLNHMFSYSYKKVRGGWGQRVPTGHIPDAAYSVTGMPFNPPPR